jgi:FlaA1/EpsC-like NDP-sugar epimerase
MNLVLKYRRLLAIAAHLTFVILANYLAFWLRFDGAIPNREMGLLLQTLPWLVVIRGLMFLPFRLYEGLWRYTGIWDLKNIILGVASSTAVFVALVRGVMGTTLYPRSVYAIDGILLILFLGGVRLTGRLYREVVAGKRERRVLIFGAGDAGEMIVRDMRNNPFYNIEPIGFVDDDPTKVGHTIHGVRVLGTRRELPRIMENQRPHEVLIAFPRAEPAQIRELVKALEPYKVPIRTLPNLREIMNGTVTVGQIRTLAVEDLLPRVQIGLDPEPIRALVEGKRVLVTGAGGSIGSELCRQIAGLDPAVLVLYERYENSLYAIANDLAHRDGSLALQSAIGDVTDASRLEAVMAECRAHIVFHAAAHKHVPLMEQNPCEAVKNNVIGTRLVAETAARFQAERFVLISSDKAVNPSSVMGATKRVGELLMQELGGRSQTRFLAVRFGNVLASSGSAVPLFMDQIKAGGPVTVTHPQMQRYFMLIPEAVQLVLHAAAMGDGGEIYVLEMGEPIKVVDMARTLIRLSGFVPDKEISITFIGPRPGEKLVEELVGMGETAESSPVPQILRVRSGAVPHVTWLREQREALERLATQGDERGVVKQLGVVVPTFRSTEKDR